MKICKSCGLEKPLSQYNRAKSNRDGLTGQCKACIHERWAKWYGSEAVKSKNAERNRAFYYSELGQQRQFEARLARYNLTHEEYLVLWERSEGVCEICTLAPATVIDHDHSSGEVRGLLCGKHNRALGGFEDSIELLNNAVKYLQR